LRSLLPILVWAVPGFAMLVLPLIYGGPVAGAFLLFAWLVSAFCLVALFLSYAPPKPKPARSASPLDPPGAPYVTTRFPTLHDNR
jgi:apolipoprotein N-acyltransferase